MYSVYQHWDPLRVMAVGSSYPPAAYDYIKNQKVRQVFYRIAEETEEDYQSLISLLHKFNIKTVRTSYQQEFEKIPYYIKNNIRIPNPYFMVPCDHTIMVGQTFYSKFTSPDQNAFEEINQLVASQGNLVKTNNVKVGVIPGMNNIPHLINRAMTTRLGKDLYIGTLNNEEIDVPDSVKLELEREFPGNRIHIVDTKGHTDATFCPVKPGLILSIESQIDYSKTFPGWEVVRLPGESWSKMKNFLTVKEKNRGKWWVPGEELNADFTEFVESWLGHWVGYAEESVFDVNIIVVDPKNVIVTGYNKIAFDAFERHGITPHICKFRHRYFWDGGLHCITSDLDRDGHMQDWFDEHR